MRYISVLGWEERFILGLEKSLDIYQITELSIFKYEEYLGVTQNNIDLARTMCNAKGVALEECSISYSDTVSVWHYIQKWVSINVQKNEEVIMDITTMPRETIWTFLFFLLQKTEVINYVYSSPVDYDRDWLCKEPDKPRLLFKHSGITEFEKDTALFLITGFDADRVGQLVNYFEPKLTILCTQVGDQYDNDKRNNLEEHKKQCAGLTQIETVFINSYSPDHGLEDIKKAITPISEKYNVIASSLGPKLSAVALYKVCAELPSIALTYVPTKEYSLNYSVGLRDVSSYRY